MKDLNMSFGVDAGSITLKKLLKREYLELQMRVISSANPNRNKSWFTPESMAKALPTFANKPILGYFSDGDFNEHNGSWKKDTETNMTYWDTLGNKGERILGTIRESDSVSIVQDEDGLSWITLSCVLWVSYAYKQVKRLIKDAQAAAKTGGTTKNVSVEVLVTDYEELEDGVLKINDFKLRGITILGSHVKPGIAGAELSLTDFEESDNFSYQQEELQLAYAAYEGKPQEENKEDDSMKKDDVVLENSAVNTEEAQNTNTDVPASPDSVNMAEEGKEGTDEENGNNCQQAEGGCGEGENLNNSLSTPAQEPAAQAEGDGTVLQQSEEKDPAEAEHEAKVGSEIYDIAWLLGKRAEEQKSLQCTLGYYNCEYVDVPHKDLIVAVLKKMLNNAIKEAKDLADLNDKIASGEFTDEYIAKQFKLAENWDSEELLNQKEQIFAEKESACSELESLKADFSTQAEKLTKYENEEFVGQVKEVLAKFSDLDEDFTKEVISKSENKEFADIEAVKTAIALHIGFAAMNKENAVKPEENSSYSAPIATPELNTDEKKTEKQFKTCWDVIEENYKK